MNDFEQAFKEKPFKTCRKRAAEWNPRWNNQETAAEMLLIPVRNLMEIETGQRIPTSDDVAVMSDMYNAPELKCMYCHDMCPIGKGRVPKVNATSLDRITINAISTFNQLSGMSQSLINIVDDGKITDDEKPELDRILRALQKCSQVAQNLMVYAEKNLNYSFEEEA